MRVRAWRVLSECIERGTMLGLGRARKHDDDPSDESVAEAIHSAIMCEVDEYFYFPEFKEEGEE